MWKIVPTVKFIGPRITSGTNLRHVYEEFSSGLTGVERLRLDEVDAIPWAAVLDQKTRIKMSISIHHCFLPVDAM